MDLFVEADKIKVRKDKINYVRRNDRITSKRQNVRAGIRILPELP